MTLWGYIPIFCDMTNLRCKLITRAESLAEKHKRKLSTISMLVTGTGKTLPDIKAGKSDCTTAKYEEWMQKIADIEQNLIHAASVPPKPLSGNSNRPESLQ